jgi:Carboxypeptidase regulatory-like domain
VQIAIGCATPIGSSIASNPLTVSPSVTAPPATRSLKTIRIAVKVNNLPPQQLDLRGETEAGGTINIDRWLVPIDRTFKLLEIRQQQLPNGDLELTSPYLLVRLHPTQWQWHPKLGRSIAIGELRKLPELKVEFDRHSSTLKFSYQLPKNAPKPLPKTAPVTLDGLPTINPPTASLTGTQERINLSGSANNELNQQGELKSVGTILGSSWYLRAEQPQLSNLLTWNLSDAIAINQNPSADWITGTQTPFWRRQGNPTGTYWGLTTIQREGFTPPASLYGGDFLPTERLQSNQLGRTVSGQAQPGTVVRLVRGFSTESVGQVLVDSSGIFRFDNVRVTSDGEFGNNYRLLLYPRGQLTADPQVKDVTFTTVPGQLPAGAAAWIASTGVNYNRVPNNFIGNFDLIQGGVAYRRGLNESVTVGAGLVYDSLQRGVGEIFWQPTGVPLQASVSAVTGDRWDVVSNVNYRPTPSVSANFSNDKFSSRGDLSWQVIPQFTASSKYDSLAGLAIGGDYTFSLLSNSSSNLQATYNLQSFLRWNASHQQQNWQVKLQGNELSLSSEVSYRIPAANGTNHNLVANYQLTGQTPATQTVLSQLLWRYQSGSLNSELGYGWSGFGAGTNASVGLTLAPGLELRGSYQGISAFTDLASYSLQVQSSIDLQGGLKTANTRVEDLRTRGGIILEPFFDRNGNGKQDPGEENYWHPELVTLDKQPLNPRRMTQLSDGVEVRALPGSYRLDLNPTHLPPHWRSSVTALRVNVALGTYTPIPLPLTPMYAIVGKVTDRFDRPVAGTEIVAIHISGAGERHVTTAKTDGSYELSDLKPGNYEVSMLQKRGYSIESGVNPIAVAIVSDRPIVQTLNFKLPPTPVSNSR